MKTQQKLLDAIAKPHDIQSLNTEELEQLANDCRERIIEVTSKRGGHLASSLGAVEIAVSLFKVFDFRRDRVVWDVGHQAYAHKLLTGRNAQFESLAQRGGIKKFLSRDESNYDHFGAGHASTSVSAALGMAISRDLQNQAHYVISVIGDGAMTGGLAFEALNHNGYAEKDMIVIVNDNGMSIDPNVGALSRVITRVISSPSYNWLREESRELTARMPFSNSLQYALQKINASLKTFLTPGMLFEQLGWRYFGPIDGHDISNLVELLTHVKDLEGPIVIHALTHKGKGYPYAEDDAFTYHGVSPFEPQTGQFVKKKPAAAQKSYSKVFGEKLGELMDADQQVVALSAAMMSGTGVIGLHEKYPERVLDVGIAEGHAVTCAAGMAAAGSAPFVAIYSTFLQRAVDHIIHDVAIQNLPVRFMLDRAGLVGADGPTHHGCFDLTYLRMIPNMVVMAPAHGGELRQMVQFAYQHDQGPTAVRYPRGNTAIWDETAAPPLQLGKAHVLQEGHDLAIFAVGVMVETAEAVAKLLREQAISAAVINARFVKPLDTEVLEHFAQQTSLIVTLEENVIMGGFGAGILEHLQQNGIYTPVLPLGLPDRYLAQGTPDQQREDAGLSVTQVLFSITERLRLLREATPKRVQRAS
jgi:1-deoxy-D-xylulose-5-phosphate synthase